MKISDIKFGYVDGKNESLESNFLEMFYDIGGYYNQLLNSKKYIISGRKGTGKTTLSSYYAKQNDNKKHIVHQLYSNDYTEKKMIEFSKDDMGLEEQSLFCEYMLFIEIGKQINKYYENLSCFYFKKYLYRKSIKKLNYLLSREIDLKTAKQITSGVNSSRSVGTNLTPKDAALDFSMVKGNFNNFTEEYTASSYYNKFSELKDLTIELLQKLELKVTFFYDDMDQLEEYMEKEKFYRLMLSMVYAVDKTNKKLYECKNSKICLIFRSDVLSQLQEHSNNLNKLTTDLSINLSWTGNNEHSPTEHPLIKMVLHKIKSSIKKEADTSDEKLYSRLFDKEIFNLLMKNSFSRPRDIISYLNCYKECYPDSEKFEFKKMKDIEKNYSKIFYEEFINELKMSDRAEELKKIINIIGQRGYPTFTYEKIKKYMEKQGEEINDLFELLGILRDYSFLGIRQRNKKIDFVYRENLSNVISETSNFVVHFGFRKYMNLD